MDLEPYSVAIGQGDGLVARAGHVVMYLADANGASPLLDALDAAAARDSPGRALAKALGAIALGPDSALVPSFGVLAPAADGLQLILRGPVTANIAADGNERTVVGDRALTWVDETLRDPVDTVTIGPRGAAPSACPHTDLRAGVVPGGGFVLHRRTQPQPAAPPPPAPAAAAPIPPQQRVAPTAFHERVAPHERQASPKPAERQGPPTPAPFDRPHGRPSDAPPRRPAAATAVARPGVGVLTVDDESVYPLDRPYVIGRNPMIDNAVRDAQASPIFLPYDPQISRVHAYVSIDGGAVLVRDAGSPAGTFVAAPGDATWTRVGNQPVALKPGWCLRIGQRILVYQKASSAQ